MKCKNCGTILEDDYNYCPNCKSDVEETKKSDLNIRKVFFFEIFLAFIIPIISLTLDAIDYFVGPTILDDIFIFNINIIGISFLLTFIDFFIQIVVLITSANNLNRNNKYMLIAIMATIGIVLCILTFFNALCPFTFTINV